MPDSDPGKKRNLKKADIPLTAETIATPNSQFREAAIWYAKNGLPVFPLRPRSKKPLTQHGFKDAVTDLKQIERWWTHTPNANIGIQLGARSRLLLLDLDYRGAAVVHERNDLIRLFGPIPDTAEVVTGSGGRHIYFRYDGSKVPREIAKGVELKAHGAYSVAPPSIHPNGTEYCFDGVEGAKALLHVAEPPPWLLEAIANRANCTAKPQATADIPAERWPDGERNNRLASLAGKLRHAGLSVESITDALLAENRKRCLPPLLDAEVRKIAVSIGRYPAGNGASTRALSVDPYAAPPSIELLNSLALFKGRIKFTWLRRRGSMIQAGFANGREAQWNSASDLRIFARSQDVLLAATGFLLPSPSKASIKRIWEPVAQLIWSIADHDATNIEPALKDEFEQIIRATWVRADRPQAFGREAFFDILRHCQNYRRDHAAEKPPRCCVWVGGIGEASEHHCWIYQDALLAWLSTPVAKSKHYVWDDVRTALLLLDFVPRELHRSLNGERMHVRVWKGPVDLLVDDDTVEESEL
jgi:hypothetical protein